MRARDGFTRFANQASQLDNHTTNSFYKRWQLLARLRLQWGAPHRLSPTDAGFSFQSVSKRTKRGLVPFDIERR
jgi:hypothetical protein